MSQKWSLNDRRATGSVPGRVVVGFAALALLVPFATAHESEVDTSQGLAIRAAKLLLSTRSARCPSFKCRK